MNLYTAIRSVLIVVNVLLLNACFTSPQSNLTEEVPEPQAVNLTNVSNNHGHDTINLTTLNVIGKNVKSYTLSGGAHSHSFAMITEYFEQLLSGTTISINTTLINPSTDHRHTIQIYYGNLAQ